MFWNFLLTEGVKSCDYMTCCSECGCDTKDQLFVYYEIILWTVNVWWKSVSQIIQQEWRRTQTNSNSPQIWIMFIKPKKLFFVSLWFFLASRFVSINSVFSNHHVSMSFFLSVGFSIEHFPFSRLHLTTYAKVDVFCHLSKLGSMSWWSTEKEGAIMIVSSLEVTKLQSGQEKAILVYKTSFFVIIKE